MDVPRLGNHDVIDQLQEPLRALLALERFHLHNVQQFQNVAADPAFDSKYLPQNGVAFRLPCFWVQRRHFYVYGRQANDGNELSLFDGGDFRANVLFPLHPTSVAHYQDFLEAAGAVDAAETGLTIWAVPSSSTRTLLAWPDEAPEKAVFLKTSLHSPIVGDRRLHLTTAARSVGLSTLVESSGAALPAAIQFLPEPASFVPRAKLDGGVIVRSIPREVKEGRVRIAPLFSLFGESGNRVPLLLTVLEQSRMRPMEFAESVLCSSFAKVWLEMSLHFGLLLEAHAQDLMLALSANLVPLGTFFYRDFEGLQVDWELRRARGFVETTALPLAWRWHDAYATWGHPHTQLIWYKLHISLFDYLHFVLHELDRALHDWHRRGLINGPEFGNDLLAEMFSHHLLLSIHERFGIRMDARINVYRHINRFLVDLLRLRRDLIHAGRPHADRMERRTHVRN